MAVQKVIPVKVTYSEDAEGHRTYKVTYKISTDSGDTPATVRLAPDLPTTGSSYQLINDSDTWATCRSEKSIAPFGEEEGAQVWIAELTFSTKPVDPSKQRCHDTPVEDPLLEPAKINGTSVNYQEEGTSDRYGNRITYSSHEQIRGQQNEWDANRSQTVIEMNVPVLNEAFIDAFMHHVNDRPLWGFPARCVKLSNWTFDRKFYNRCSVYYTLKLTFDKRRDGFDKDILDEASKCLNGHWEGDQYRIDPFSNGVRPDPANPHHFIKFQDKNGNFCKVVLNGSGVPAGIQLATGMTLVSTVAIANGALTVLQQPTGGPIYPRLTVKIVDDDNSISSGLVTITGNDEHGNVVQEIIDFSDAGTVDYVTQFRYMEAHYTVSSVIGATVADTIEVVTDTSQEEAGNIHVEYYEEANLLLLGIPVTY